MTEAKESVAPARWYAASPSWRGHAALIEAADEIIGRGLWCVVEVCVDVPNQIWERRLVVLRRDGAGVAEAVADWVRTGPAQDVRLNGCSRTDLRPVADSPTRLCYLAIAEQPVTS